MSYRVKCFEDESCIKLTDFGYLDIVTKSWYSYSLFFEIVVVTHQVY